jgi:hypothetical protein
MPTLVAERMLRYQGILRRGSDALREMRPFRLHRRQVCFFRATGGAAAITPFARRVGLVPCVVGSFATRRPSGFGEAEIGCLKSI